MGDGEEVEDLLMLDLTHEEIKAAFRLFDDSGEGFITVMRFRVRNGIMSCNIIPLPSIREFTFQVILKEIDEEFTEDELDEIIAEVGPSSLNIYFYIDMIIQIDTDKSDTIDFNEFVKIMT